MAKVLKTAALVVGAVALVATGIGAAAALSSGVALSIGTGFVSTALSGAIGVGIGGLAAISAGLSLAAGFSARKPDMSGSACSTMFKVDHGDLNGKGSEDSGPSDWGRCAGGDGHRRSRSAQLGRRAQHRHRICQHSAFGRDRGRDRGPCRDLGRAEPGGGVQREAPATGAATANALFGISA